MRPSFFLFCSLIFAISAPRSEGVCCHNDKGYHPFAMWNEGLRGKCADGSRHPTPCCSYRACDWNCCQCSSPCRKAGMTEAEAIEDERAKHSDEARIILPMFTNEGKSLQFIREKLEARLRNELGGFTVLNGKGEWTDETGNVFKDPSWIYDLHVDGPQKRKTLRDIATWLRDAAGQKAIYVRMPGGKVTFV